MAVGHLRHADRRRRAREVVALFEQLPRQMAALESAMAAFGGDFDAEAFRAAFETTHDMPAYNRVQAVERGLGRVQNFVADLAIAGVQLARLPAPHEHEGSPARRAFASLRDAHVIDGALCRRLMHAQGARSRIEHAYVDVSAADVHRAALLVHDTAQQFVPRFRRWVEPYLPA